MTDFLKNLYLVLFGQVLNIDCSGFFFDISDKYARRLQYLDLFQK